MDDFDKFWEEVLDFSTEVGLEPDYVESEFIILGELVKVYPNPLKRSRD